MVRFEKIEKYKDVDFEMPQRKTKYSAGYDFVAVKDITIPSYILNLGKIFIDKITNKDLMKILENTQYGIIAKNLSEYDMDQLSELSSKHLPEVIEIFSKEFSMSLQEVKEAIKKAEAVLTLIPTGVKAYMEDNQFLQLAIRSSIPMNNYITLANGVGIIDADYVDNISNEGHIFFQVINFSPFSIEIKKGDIIGQGMFINYSITDDDMAGGERVGGQGSTTK